MERSIQKAYSFVSVYEEFKEHMDASRLEKPAMIDDDVWEEFIDNIGQYASILCNIGLYDPLTCSKEDFSKHFVSYSSGKPVPPEILWASSRKAFEAIGRSDSEGGRILKIFGKDLVDTTNPASGGPPASKKRIPDPEKPAAKKRAMGRDSLNT
jgi:hypothetical protein